MSDEGFIDGAPKWAHRAFGAEPKKADTETRLAALELRCEQWEERSKVEHAAVVAVTERFTGIMDRLSALEAKPKKGARLAEDWKPTGEDRIYAKKQGLTHQDIEDEAEKFYDFWTAKAGQRACKRDWAATWRTWTREAAGRLGRSKAREDAPVEAKEGPLTQEAVHALERILGDPRKGVVVRAELAKTYSWAHLDGNILMACAGTVSQIARFTRLRGNVLSKIIDHQRMVIGRAATKAGVSELTWPRVEW